MRAAISLLLLGVAGCAVGPDFHTSPPPDVAAYTPGRLPAQTASAGSKAAPAQRLSGDLDIPGLWWETFHSQPLRDLVAEALQQNADLQAAQAALRVALENAEAQKGLFFPQIGDNYTATRQLVSSDISSPLSSNAYLFSLHTAQLNLSYSPDVFGLNARQVESLDALATNQRFQVEATYLTLTSNLVATAIQEASLRAQIVATKRIITIEADVLKILRRQKAAGQVAEADVAVQEAALAQAQQTLPPLEKQLAQQRDLLTALAGRYAVNEIEEKFSFATLQLPRNLPLSIPSQLVRHRPDVQAAEANLHSASALVGVAVANRLPVINLTANVGSSAANLAQLFTPYTAFWALTGSVSQTIFDGMTLYHKQKAAEAALEQADAQYRSTVIIAFQNVADTLRAIEADARAFRAAVVAERAAAKSLDIVRKQLEYGQVNSVIVLNAQQTYLQALLTRIQAQANRYSDTVALFQALGGGWWNRIDVVNNVTLFE